MKITSVILSLLAMLIVQGVRGADRPNILWITCEDISPYLGCYGRQEALTPNLDRMAQKGVRYSHAYANAPVCATARSTLLSGMYATTIGTHQMRCRAQLPAVIPAYPKILRQAGYYCTNNSKKDYNSNFQDDPTLWDESSRTAHYKNRAPGQPFFAVFNITVTHESQLNPKRIAAYVASERIPARPRVNPADIKLPPYHPDLPEIREDWARLHDLITLMDTMVGDRLRELDELGLADDTIVFFYSDHGGQLSRSKRYIYNVGVQVPLIIRFPEKWRRLAPAPPGGVVDRLVSFVDFPKTVLSLCGAPIPELMQGRIFLGPNAESPPRTVHFFRDRMAERYDFVRAVTDGRWFYIRNFMPHRPRGRDSRYGYQVQRNWGAWERYYEAGKCDDIQSQFYQPKPTAELFDTPADPWQVHNLAKDPGQEKRVRRLQADLDRWMIQTRDIGLIPEPLFYDVVGPDKPFKTLYEYAQSDQYPIERLLRVAKEASRGEAGKAPDYIELLSDDNPIARYWGAYGLFLVRSDKPQVRTPLKRMMENDPLAGDRIMAAQALARSGDPDSAFKAIYKETLAAANGYVLLQALNAFQYGHVDDRLTREDWEAFRKLKPGAASDVDKTGLGYAQRIIADALSIWPNRRRVD